MKLTTLMPGAEVQNVELKDKFLPYWWSLWFKNLVEFYQSHLWLITSKVTNRMRIKRKWIFDINTGNGMIVHVEGKSESVAACAQIKDDMKNLRRYYLCSTVKYKLFCSSWPWTKLSKAVFIDVLDSCSISRLKMDWMYT